MYEYKTELMKIPYRLLNATVTEEDMKKLDAMINRYADYGWELVTYTHMGGNNEVEKGLLATFRKKREDSL